VIRPSRGLLNTEITPLPKVTVRHLTAPQKTGLMDPFKKDFLGAVSVAKMIFKKKKAILKFRLGIRIPIFFTQDSCSCSKKKTPPKTPRKLRCISSAFPGHIFRCTDVRFQEVSPAKSSQLDVSGSLDQWLVSGLSHNPQYIPFISWL